MDLIEIGERIREARKGLGINQAQLARRAEVARTTVIGLETGATPEIGVKMLARIMNAVGLDLRPGPINEGRPTLDDLMAENEGDGDAPRMGR